MVEGSRKVNVSTKPQVCTRCGKSPQHGKGQCPAREAICHKCGKKGHYKKMCWSKQGDNKVGVVRDEEEEDRTFLGVVQSSANRGIKPLAQLCIRSGVCTDWTLSTNYMLV